MVIKDQAGSLEPFTQLLLALGVASLSHFYDFPRVLSGGAMHPRVKIAMSMPPELAAWGCDEDLWSQIKSKGVFRTLAREGKEKEARERISLIRQVIEDEKEAEQGMPAELTAWGCDEDLWSQLKNQKGLFCKLAREGNEKEARERISLIRQAIEYEKEAEQGMPAELAAWGCDEDLWNQLRLKSKKQFCRLAREGKEEDVREKISRIRMAIGGSMPPELAAWGCDANLWNQLTKSKESLRRLVREGKEDVAREKIALIRQSIEAQKEAAQGMPAELAAWGCDEDLWSQLKNKGLFREFAREGKEEEAREKISRIRMAIDQSMPPELAAWGCDEDLWSKIKNKGLFRDFAREGKEEEAREKISQIRMAIDGSMPPELAAWGCDEDLWSKIKNKGLFREFAREGKEEEAREKISRIRRIGIGSMPPELAAWGCDADVWNQLKSKGTLRKLAREGKEEEARERISLIRQAIENEKEAEQGGMPAELAAWGCDEDLWSQIKNKGLFCEFAREGKEEEAREKISRIRMAIDQSMPPELAAWGCDEDLWSQIESKGKFRTLAREGKEDEARERIDRIRGKQAV